MNKIKEALIFLILPLFVFACSSTKEIKRPRQFGFEEPILSKAIHYRGSKGIPLNPTATFSTEDPTVIASLKLRNISERHTLRWDWYDPNGNLYSSTGNYPIKASKGKYLRETTAWHKLSIRGERAARNLGEWKVNVYLDREFIASKSFEIKPEPSLIARIKPIEEKPKMVKFPKKGNYYAVVIGIGKYKDDKIPKLKYTTVDAQSIYNILTDPKYGNFPKDHVRKLIDEEATDNNIKSAIGTWLRRNARKDDTVIIFYAGHGAPEDDKTYWVTYNANIDDLYGTALSNDEIADMLNRVESEKMIVFLDSCYSAATIHRTDKRRSIMIVKDPFQKFKGKGRVVITSSDGKEESLELDKFGHGVFTYYLLKALKGEADENKDGFVELDEIWDYVKYRVADTARRHGSTQTPVIDGSYSAGILLSSNPERLKELYLKTEREKKRKELESKIAKLKELWEKSEITDIQFNKAVEILQSGKKNRYLDKFLSDKISLTVFKASFK
jgi:uncharacterized caspase-like protein